MHKHDYTGAQVVRMRRQLREEKAKQLWLRKLLAVAIILCGTNRDAAGCGAGGRDAVREEGQGCLELPQKRCC